MKILTGDDVFIILLSLKMWKIEKKLLDVLHALIFLRGLHLRLDDIAGRRIIASVIVEKLHNRFPRLFWDDAKAPSAPPVFLDVAEYNKVLLEASAVALYLLSWTSDDSDMSYDRMTVFYTDLVMCNACSINTRKDLQVKRRKVIGELIAEKDNPVITLNEYNLLSAKPIDHDCLVLTDSILETVGTFNFEAYPLPATLPVATYCQHTKVYVQSTVIELRDFITKRKAEYTKAEEREMRTVTIRATVNPVVEERITRSKHKRTLFPN